MMSSMNEKKNGGRDRAAVCVVVGDEMRDQIRRAAAACGMTMAPWVRQILKNHLEMMAARGKCGTRKEEQ